MHHLSTKMRALPLTVLGLLFLIPFATHTAGAGTVSNGDFQAQSFSKVVDWYDYVRQYAANNGLPQPNATEHAYIYTNYINVGGFQLFYAGLVNATHNGTFVTIPIQTFFEHFKTVGGKDAITASSDRKSTRLNSSHSQISYAVFCLKKKNLEHTSWLHLQDINCRTFFCCRVVRRQ